MSTERFMSYSLRPLLQALLLALLLILHLPFSKVEAGEMENLLPPISCGTGWKIEGKPALYDRETLSDRIPFDVEQLIPHEGIACKPLLCLG